MSKRKSIEEKTFQNSRTLNFFIETHFLERESDKFCFWHLPKVGIITSYWFGFKSKFHLPLQVKKKLHLGRNLLWFSARAILSFLAWTRTGETRRRRRTRKMKPRSKNLGCESNEEVEEEMRGFWPTLKWKKKRKMTWWADWRGGRRGNLHVSLAIFFITKNLFHAFLFSSVQERSII